MSDESRHKRNFHNWVADQKRHNAKMKEGRAAALSSAKDQMKQDMVHKIENELKLKRRGVDRSTFSGFARPWKGK